MYDQNDNFEPKVIMMTSDDSERRFYIFDKEVVLFSRIAENVAVRRKCTVVDLKQDTMYDIEIECEVIRRLVRYATNLTPGIVEDEPPEWEEYKYNK